MHNQILIMRGDSMRAEKKKAILKLIAEFFIVFVGIYLAFLMNNYSMQRQEQFIWY